LQTETKFMILVLSSFLCGTVLLVGSVGVDFRVQGLQSGQANDDWPMFHHDPSRTGVSSSNITLPLELAWTYNSSLGGTLGDLIVANGTVYVSYANGYIFAIDGTSGSFLWNYKVSGNPLEMPAYCDGTVVVSDSAGKIVGLDGQTGAKKFNLTLGQSPQPMAGPCISGNAVYFATKTYADNPLLYSIDASTGNTNWVTSLIVPSTYFVTDEAYYPALIGDTLYLSARSNGYWGGEGSILCAIYAETGTYRWNSTLNSNYDAIHTVPTGDSSQIYVSTHTKKVYALDSTDGTIKWTFSAGSDDVFDCSPALYNGIVYVGSDNGMFYALYANNGTQKWSFARGTSAIKSSPTISNGVVYFESENKNLYGLNATTGGLLWTYQFSSAGDYSPAISNNDYLYTGCSDGLVYAFTHYAVKYQLSVTISTSHRGVLSGSTTPLVINVYNGTLPISGATVTLDAGGQGSFSKISDMGNGTYTTNFHAPTVTAATPLIISAATTHAGPYLDSTTNMQITIYPLNTTVPGPPTGLVASNLSSPIILSWNPPANSGGAPITNYTIYRGNFSGTETFWVEIGNATTYNDTNVVNATWYYYRVSAVDDMGEGQKSNEVGPVFIPEFLSLTTLLVVMGLTMVFVGTTRKLSKKETNQQR